MIQARGMVLYAVIQETFLVESVQRYQTFHLHVGDTVAIAMFRPLVVSMHCYLT